MGDGFLLLEREREIGLAADAIDRICRSEGGILVYEGSAGMGKSSLLRVLRDDAAARRVRVLSARGGELEQDFAWGVVRQLFETWLSAIPADESRTLLSGPATLATSLFEYRDALTRDPGDLHAVLHGLYWLCQNLSAQKPLALVIDDVQWSDTASLRFISYLANRLEGTRVGLILGGAPTDDGVREHLLSSIYASPAVRLVRLGPLSRQAVRAMTTMCLEKEPAETFAQACHHATDGNPLFLCELLAEVAAEGLAPEAAAVPRVERLAPRRVAVDVLRRLKRLSDRAVRVAGAVAVLGPDAAPRHCAQVSAMSDDELTGVAGSLIDAGMLRPSTPYTFSHPIISTAVYAALTARDRNRAHRRAARSLADAVAPPERVAEHLCRTQPGTDQWVVSRLRAGARDVLRAGSPELAARFLQRALAEPPAPDIGSAVLAELGAAGLRAGDRGAIGHLREALRRTTRSAQRRAVRLDLGQALVADGRYEEAMEVLGEESAAAAPGGPGYSCRLMPPRTAPVRGDADTDTDGEAAGCRAGPRSTRRAQAAFAALHRGIPAARVARLAASALEGGVALEPHDVEMQPPILAALVLTCCDRLPDAERVLTDTIHQAGEEGQLLAAATATGLRAMVLFEGGRLPDAEREARSVLRGVTEDSLTVGSVPLAAAVLVSSLIEADRPQQAEDLLTRLGLAGPLPESGYFLPLWIARGRLSIALGRLEEGAQDLLACRDLARDRGWDHPTLVASYLPAAAHALSCTGRVDLVRECVRDQLGRARLFGAPRPLAVALRTHGLLIGGRAGLERIEEAAEMLRDSPAVLELGQTQVALGSALRRAGHRGDARRHLLAGIETAQRCGARGREKQARIELRLAGGRLRGAQVSAATPLTPAERRVALKAAEGRSNKEIARELFVTVKTVEWHLNQTYPKLGISRRSELSHALTASGVLAEEECDIA
ncbi:helix-turn-helix transcriptional regulator [Streptomyces sp. NPDC055078]